MEPTISFTKDGLFIGCLTLGNVEGQVLLQQATRLDEVTFFRKANVALYCE